MRGREPGLKARQARVKKPAVVVCPICWRKNCPLFVRLEGYKFSDEQKTQFFVAFHRDVCCCCRKLQPTAHKTGVCVFRKFNHKLHAFPAWWLGEKS